MFQGHVACPNKIIYNCITLIYAGRQVKGPPTAFQAEDRGVRLSLPAPFYLGIIKLWISLH